MVRLAMSRSGWGSLLPLLFPLPIGVDVHRDENEANARCEYRNPSVPRVDECYSDGQQDNEDVERPLGWSILHLQILPRHDRNFRSLSRPDTHAYLRQGQRRRMMPS